MKQYVEQLEKEEEIDVKNIYLRNFKPHQPRVGKEYQAIIPDCISAPKKKEIKPKTETTNTNNEKEKGSIKASDKNNKKLFSSMLVYSS